MRKAYLLFEILVFVKLYYLNLYEFGRTSLWTSGRNEPIASRKGYWGLLEKPSAKIFQGAE